MIEFILFILGIIGIWFFAGIVVDAAQRIARHFNISEAFMGLTIISIGTSLPEISTHIIASIDILKGIETSGIAVGTNIGSNIIQITFVLGLVALLTKVYSNKTILKRDYLIMLATILFLFLLSLDGKISRIEGAILATLYIGYLIWLGTKEKIIEHNEFKTNYWLDSFLIIAGIAALFYSANLVVNNALKISDLWGLSGSFIGTVIIGVSTALPELTVALRAILKGSTGISLGTLVGSNITNPMLALGIGAIISGYTMDSILTYFDLPFWFFVSLIALLFFWKNLRISKKEAIMLIIAYLIYVALKLKLFMH